jgi:hypothetical protein
MIFFFFRLVKWRLRRPVLRIAELLKNAEGEYESDEV